MGIFKKVLRGFKYEVLLLVHNCFIYTFKLPKYTDMDSMWKYVNSDDLLQVESKSLSYVRVCDKKLYLIHCELLLSNTVHTQLTFVKHSYSAATICSAIQAQKRFGNVSECNFCYILLQCRKLMGNKRTAHSLFYFFHYCVQHM